jgi:hypothetical protein
LTGVAAAGKRAGSEHLSGPGLIPEVLRFHSRSLNGMAADKD